MNVFILDKDPATNARYHADRHVVKMILEASQLASNAHWWIGHEPGPYRFTHANHPLTAWTASSIHAYNFVVKYGLALCAEYRYRYDKTHKCHDILHRLLADPPPGMSELVPHYLLVMPKDCQVEGDVVQSYRNYYNNYKRHLFSWKRRDVPEWIIL